MAGETQRQLAQRYHSHFERYDYFLMAIAGAAIALALHRTEAAKLEYRHLWLGAAILSWAASIFAGCRRQVWLGASFRANYELLRVQSGTHEHAGEDPQMQHAAMDSLREVIEEHALWAGRWARTQFGLLVLGAVLYAVWHVVEMARR